MSTLMTPLLRALQVDWPGAVVVAVSIVLLFATSELIHRLTRIPTEYTRKLTHVGGGVIVLGLPWLLSNTWTVGLLSLSFLGVLVAGRMTGLLGSVHDVDRRTGGAYYYPFAIFGTWWLSQGDPLLFMTPVAIMALADTGAALVGSRPGNLRYRVLDNHRSVEGSLTFFSLSFAVVLVGLAIAGRPGWPAMLLVTLVTALICTATEAISVQGSDNIFIPYAAFLVLDRTLRLGLSDLSGWIEGMLLSLILVAISWRGGRLTTAGAVATFLVGSLAWALGGWTWSAPLLALYLLFLLSMYGVPRAERPDLDLDEVLPTTVGSMIVVLAFAHFAADDLFVPYLGTLAANGAIAMARLAGGRGWPRAPLALAGLITPVLPVLLYQPDLALLPIVLGGLMGLAAFGVLARTHFVGRRMVASLLGGAVAWAAL